MLFLLTLEFIVWVNYVCYFSFLFLFFGFPKLTLWLSFHRNGFAFFGGLFHCEFVALFTMVALGVGIILL
jgi:hypothetical protein